MSFFDWSDVLDEAEEVQNAERAAISITAHSLKHRIKTAGHAAAAAASSPTGRRWSITAAAAPLHGEQPASPTVVTALMAGQHPGCSAAPTTDAPTNAPAISSTCRAAAADIEVRCSTWGGVRMA